MRAVCVYCGSSPGRRAIFREAATGLGRELASRGLTLVYGGGNVGLMGVVADAALAAGGSVVGVIPQALLAKELGHLGLTELIVVETMHERKQIMADRSDAFVTLPGGFGTFEESCETLTWGQLGIHRKPCGLLNVDGFYDPLLAQFDLALAEGFLRPAHRDLVVTGDSPDTLLDRLATYRPPLLPKWIDDEET